MEFKEVKIEVETNDKKNSNQADTIVQTEDDNIIKQDSRSSIKNQLNTLN